MLRCGWACTPAEVAPTAKARRAGLAVATAEGCLASIATAKGVTVATRDTRRFEAAGASVIHSWPA